MFTGIIERRGRVVAISGTEAGKRIVLEVEAGPGLPEWKPAAIGESIAVSGVCLTAVESAGARVGFDGVPETLRLTTLGRLREGERVNLERSLAAGERFGGHYVTGHVDGTGTVVERRAVGEQALFCIEASKRLIDETIPKGSIAVDGVSLTVVEVSRSGNWFSFAAIPHTLEITTLGARQVGDLVNLETDAFGKWILHALREILPGAPPTRLG